MVSREIKATQGQQAQKVTEDCRANVVYKVCKGQKVTKVSLVLRVLMVKHSTLTLPTLTRFPVAVLAKPTLTRLLSVCTKISALRIAGIHKTIAGLNGRVVTGVTVFPAKLERTDEHLTSILPTPTALMVELVSV